MTSHHERLSALDATFLELEDDAMHMHVGAVIVFDGGPLILDHGGVDIDRVRAYIDAVIDKVPRYRQRLAFGPMLKHPVWVDDDRFNIHYHIRHTGLPRPGDERQLKRLAGRIFSQRLDRSRPLWEFWVVEGLGEGRFALITKAHHCMVDGMAGMGLMAALLRTSPRSEVPEASAWVPRPAPSKVAMAAAELRHRARAPRKLFDRARELATGEAEWLDQAREAVSGVAETLTTGMVPASRTPLSIKSLGPHRRFDVVRFDLAAVKSVKKALGGKVNDVVLATVAGALRRFFERRGTNPAEVADFRVGVPVAVKAKAGRLGNHVSMMFVRLPIAEPDVAARYEEVVQESARTKANSKIAQSGELLDQMSDYTGAKLIGQTARLARFLRPFNIIVTNVPGPPFPLYMLGARLQAVYPLVPLWGSQAIGIALFSYAGGLYWGLTADWEAVGDLHELAEDLRAAFAELEAAAEAR